MRIIIVVTKRLLFMPILIFGLLVLVFFITRVIPADPMAFLAGGIATQEEIQALKYKWGLDKPLHIQFVEYLKQLIRGEFGISYYTHRPVIEDILRRIPATLELTFAAVGLSVVIGIAAGLLSALYRNSILDHVLRVISIGGLSTVSFWLAIMLQLIISYLLGWLPLIGRIGVAPPHHITGFYILDSILTLNGSALVSSITHLILPATSIAVAASATIVRFTRAGVLSVLQSEHVFYVKAMGLPKHIIILKYVLKNAAISTVTQIGLVFASLLGGAVIVETIFDWPGVGIHLIKSILLSDYKVILATSLWIGLVFIIINIIIDIVHLVLDPRRVSK